MNETFTAGGGPSGLKIREGGKFAYQTDVGGTTFVLQPGAKFEGSSAFYITYPNQFFVSLGDLHWAIIDNKFGVEPGQEFGYTNANGIEYRFKVTAEDYNHNGITWVRTYVITNTGSTGRFVPKPPPMTAYFHYTPKE